MSILPLGTDIPSEEELDRIESYLLKYGSDSSVLNISELDGFLTAIVSGPETLMPSTWLPAIWGASGDEPMWESMEEAQDFTQLVFRMMNYNASVLMQAPERFEGLYHYRERDDQGTPIYIVDEWCRGYLRGVDSAIWPSLPAEAQYWLDIIEFFGRNENFDRVLAMSITEHQEKSAEINPAARQLHAWWFDHRSPPTDRPDPVRAEPKVGRNDPCPCGSGKKFKRCCLH